MSFMDNSLSFNTSWSSSQTVSATADSTTIVDVTGAGSGNAPAMIGAGGVNTAIGFDIGAGDGEAIPYLYSTATADGTGSGTVTIALKAAPDNGSYSPGTYTTLWTSTAYVGTNIKKGAYLIVPVPPTLFNFPGSPPGASNTEALPRFYKLTYTVSGTFSTPFNSGLMINPPSSLIEGQYGNNFTVV